MSVISGGIFSKPRGKTGGLVFGAARTRQGKLATVRELVSPSNPNTPLQQTQRSKFKSTLDIVKRIGSTIYRNDWNRSVGQLPGFQSMMAVLLNQMNSNKQLILTQDVNLGVLPKPDELAFTSPAAGQVTIGWASGGTYEGHNDDQVVGIFIAKEDVKRGDGEGVHIRTGRIIDNESIDLTAFTSGDVVEIYFYVKGVGTHEGMYSPAFHGEVTVS